MFTRPFRFIFQQIKFEYSCSFIVLPAHLQNAGRFEKQKPLTGKISPGSTTIVKPK